MATRDRPRLTLILCLALFVVAVIPRLYHVRSRFMTVADHNTANLSIFARNSLEHGWLDTRFGMVSCAWPEEPSRFIWFAHHPPGVPLLASISFGLFGISEPAARWMPLLLSAATSPLLYLLGRRWLGPGWALLAGVLFAFAPGAIYYGQSLNPEAFVVFLGLLAIEAWRRHEETGTRAIWRTALILVAAATLMDWPGTYAGAAIATAVVLSPAMRGRKIRAAAQVLATAAVCAAAALAHIGWVMGSFEDIGAALSWRVLSAPHARFSFVEVLQRLWENVAAAVTAPVRSLAVAGAAAAVITAVWVSMRRHRHPDSAGQEAAVGWGLAAAVLLFGLLHHLMFTNASFLNPNLVYFVIPAVVLLAAALPACVELVLSRWMPRRAATALALLASLPALVAYASQVPARTSEIFTSPVAPGWSILGQALSRAVPEDRQIVSTGTLAYPQLRHYLWRHVWHDRKKPEQFTIYGRPVVLLRDVNMPVPEATETLLAERPSSEALIYDAFDLEPGSRPPDIQKLGPPEPVMTLRDERFGDALALEMSGIGPEEIVVDPPSRAEAFFGVPWTPEIAAPRFARATVEWTRLEGPAASLVPEYQLQRVVDGRVRRVPVAWPLEGEGKDLGRRLAGERARQRIYFFFGEWLPPGEYILIARVKEGAELLPVTTEGSTGLTRQATLGRVVYRYR